MELEMMKLGAICLAQLERLGYTVEQSCDFQGIAKEIPDIGKALISPTMSFQINDFTEENAFWIVLRKSSQLVAVMAMRIDRIGRGSVDRFWSEAYSRHYPTEKGVSVSAHVPVAVRQLTGDLVYMGDLHFREEDRKYRPTLMCFVHLAHALCFTKWRHDWTYAFHRREDVLRGYADRYGFNNRWPGAQIWTDPPSYRSSSEFLSVISREEFEQKAAYYARFPDELTRPDPRFEPKEKQNS